MIMRRSPDGQNVEITPQGFNVRSRVHEYGGGAYTVSQGVVFFSNFADQRVYRQENGSEPRPITPERAFRYADFEVDQSRNRLICVREDHTAEGLEAVNTLVSLGMESDEDGGEVLVSGNDFYSSSRLSPDGKRLAWLTWNHPNMPWDGTELWVADVNEDGSLGNKEKIAGGPQESIFQPEWSPNGTLYFVSDRTGWWNLYRIDNDKVDPVHEMEAEFGVPQWQFGMSTYGFASDGRIICLYTAEGFWYLASLDTNSRKLSTMGITPNSLGGLQVGAGKAVLIGAWETEPPTIATFDLDTGIFDVIRSSPKGDCCPPVSLCPACYRISHGERTCRPRFFLCT